MKTIFFMGIAAGAIALGDGLVAPAAVAQQKPTAQNNLHYDVYQPSERKRLRRDVCGKDEHEAGAYCVKKCDAQYVAVPNAKPPRCRSIEPLAPGVMPSAIRVQTGVQPLPPGTPAPPNRAPSGEGTTRPVLPKLGAAPK